MKDNRISALFGAVRLSSERKELVAARMLEERKKKPPLWKATAAFTLVLAAALGWILIPRAATPSSGTKEPDRIQFTVYAAAQKKEIGLSADAVQITLENGDKYRSGGGGNGKVTLWNEQIDFNLRCTGRPDIARVTYTAHNCEFMKKTFFSKSQYENGEAMEYADGAAWGETKDDGTEAYWGFAPIGYVYSADFLEEVNLTNFGLKIEYTEENADQYKAYSSEASKKTGLLRQAAYQKAYITAEIMLEDGSKIEKTIRLSPAPGYGNVSVWVENGTQNPAG